MLIAEFYNGTKTVPTQVVFSNLIDGRRELISERSVTGRREARIQAKARGAVCWNF